MMLPSPDRRPRSARAPQLSLLLLFAVACGGADLDVARGHLRRGDLAKAEAALGEAQGRSADELRRRIAESHEARRAVSEELERLAALGPSEEREGLAQLLEGLADPVLVERVELAVSKAADRAAEVAGQDRRSLKQTTEERIARARRQLMNEGPVVPDTPGPGEGRAAPASGLAQAPSDTAGPETEGPREPVVAEAEERAPEPATSSPVATASEAAPTSTAPEPEVPSESEPEPAPVSPADLLAPELAKAEKVLLKATDERRTEAWAALSEYGEHARPHLRRALEARWASAHKAVVKSPTSKMLERLAQDREELDFRRGEALALIFDEEEYFYPYRPPECPPQKARKYWPVQQRVDELVAELRDVWTAPRTVKLASSFREDVAELLWCRERAEEVGLVLELGEELPAWVLLTPIEAKTIDLHEFAWDADEARRLANDRAVLAFNGGNWQKDALEGLEEDRQAGSEERRQVEITNEYRRMFGRKLLAWNPLLQASADGHSDYMAKTGNFGHYEEGDEERRSPFDRMRLVGYNFGVSENCHMGGGSPQGAHDAWCKSSGHHRNILMEGHTEMGSAVNGRYWTQNYGTDKEFRSEIDTWLD